METTKVVGDGVKKGYRMSNEDLGLFTRRVDEIKKRIRETGTESDVEFVAEELQSIAEKIGFFDPRKFFVTRQGLWVSDNFRDRILSVAKKIAKVSMDGANHFDLPTPMNDAETQKRLGEGYIYEDASEFCSVLAGMIDRQPNGEVGVLVNNGKANIFYVRGKNDEVFAVIVYWNADDREWRVIAYLLDGSRWSADCRAFSRNSNLDK
ncbi:MAG: hypothetical protein PHX25_00315 [Candidatus Pacebacteria bacterium]|nr:hypothetical protein [Candidatus Paceibacterota bacterium]